MDLESNKNNLIQKKLTKSITSKGVLKHLIGLSTITEK